MSSSITLNAIPLIGPNNAPGNYLFEQDDTAYAQPPSTSIGGIVLGVQQGPIMCKITGGPSEYLTKYGKPNPNWSLAAYNALTYLKASPNLIVRRVINSDALAAASYLFLDSGAAFQAVDGVNPAYTPYQDLDFVDAVPSFGIINVYPNFAVLPSTTPITVSYQLNGGNTVTASTTIGANLSALVANLNAALASAGVSVALSYISITYPFNYTVPALYFIGPTNASFSLVNMSWSSSVITPFPQANAYNDFLGVVAANHGAWANNNIGWNITNVDMGTPQQITITFNRQLVAGDTIVLNGDIYTPGLAVNTNAWNFIVTSAPYATSNDATLTAFAALISTNSYVDATAVIPDTTGNNAREIILTFQRYNFFNNFYALASTLTSPNNGPCDWTTLNVVTTHTSGVGALSAIIQQTVLGRTSTGLFNFNVYSASNSNVPLETFRGGLNPGTDGMGNDTNIINIVNNDASGSNYLRLVSAAPTPNTFFPNVIDNVDGSIYWLNGGADGSLPTNVQIAAAWNDFADVDNIDVDILINGGYATSIVAQAMDAVCQTRMDMAFSYLDTPSAAQGTSAGLLNYRQNQLNLSSDKSGLFAPDVFITDPYTGQNLYVPISGYEAALQALADAAVGPNQAAAGPTYGILNNILGLRTIFGVPDRGLLNGAQVNIAKKLRAGGYAVYGALTLQEVPSLLSYIPVRRIFSYIEQLVLDLLEGVDFNNITPTLELNVQQTVSGYLRLFIAQGAIEDATCITGSTINQQQYGNNGQFNVRVIVFPYSPAQFVALDGVLTNDSTLFTETVVNV